MTIDWMPAVVMAAEKLDVLNYITQTSRARWRDCTSRKLFGLLFIRRCARELCNVE